MLKSAWISSPTGWDLLTTSLAKRESLLVQCSFKAPQLTLGRLSHIDFSKELGNKPYPEVEITWLCYFARALTELLVFPSVGAGPPVWTPLCSALWLRSTKPVCPAALCSDTSNSWRTSHASVTTSSQYTSAPAAPVSRPHPREIFPPFSDTRVGNVIGVFLSLFHRTSALWTCSLITCCSCLFSSGLPPHLSPGSPQSVQGTKDANLQKLTQLVNKESNLIEKVPLLSY